MNEEEIIMILRNLPVSVQVTRRSAGFYSWQCLEKNGWADDLAGAMTAGLTALVEQVAGDAGALDDLTSKQI